MASNFRKEIDPRTQVLCYIVLRINVVVLAMLRFRFLFIMQLAQ